MSRPTQRENLVSLANQLIWGLDTYVKAGIDDIKGDSWDSTLDTMHHVGTYVTHDTRVFPEATNLTLTVAGHVDANTWSTWAEMQDSGATTFSSKVTSITHLTAINIEDTSASGLTWMLETSYGEAKVSIARIRFVSASIGNLPAITGVRIRSTHIPAGETVYARLMCSGGGEDCKLHLRYYLD